jgi:hypothetical protein
LREKTSDTPPPQDQAAVEEIRGEPLTMPATPRKAAEHG